MFDTTYTYMIDKNERSYFRQKYYSHCHFDFMDKVINIAVYHVGLAIWTPVAFEGTYQMMIKGNGAYS